MSSKEVLSREAAKPRSLSRWTPKGWSRRAFDVSGPEVAKLRDEIGSLLGHGEIIEAAGWRDLRGNFRRVDLLFANYVIATYRCSADPKDGGYVEESLPSVTYRVGGASV